MFQKYFFRFHYSKIMTDFIIFEDDAIIDKILENLSTISTDGLFFRHQMKDGRKIYLNYEIESEWSSKGYLFILKNDDKTVLYIDSLIINENDDLRDPEYGVLNRIKDMDSALKRKARKLFGDKMEFDLQKLSKVQQDNLRTALYLRFFNE